MPPQAPGPVASPDPFAPDLSPPFQLPVPAVTAFRSPSYTGQGQPGTQLFYSSWAYAGTVVTDAGSTLQVSSVTGLPQLYPYKLLLEWGTGNQEVALVTSAPTGNGPYQFTGVLRGCDGGGPQITHAPGAAVNHGVSAADFGQIMPAFNVCSFGADPNNVNDSAPGFQAAVNACVTAGGGLVYVPSGSYTVRGTVTVNCTTGPVYITGAGNLASTVYFAGTGDCFRAVNLNGTSVVSGGGIKALTIDGSNAASPANGLHVGSMLWFGIDAEIQNFTSAGSLPVLFDGTFDPSGGSVRYSSSKSSFAYTGYVTGSGAGTGSGTASGITLATPTTFRYSRAALARSRNAGTPFRIQFYGDSILNGTGMTTAQTQAYPERFRAIAAARSLGAGDIVSEGLIWLNNTDTRITPGSWAPVGVGPGSQGCLLGSSGQTMTVALPSCDHVNVYFPNYGGGVGFANLDGGTNTTFNCASGAAVGQFITLTGSATTHTLNLGISSGANAAVFAVEYWTAASTSTIRTSRCGSVGSTAANWAVSGGVNSLPASNGVVVPDLVVLGLGTNDIQQAESVSVFIADMQQVITQLQTTATDIILVSPYYSTYAVAGPQASAVNSAIANLAMSNNCGLWNQTLLWQSYAAANTDGYIYTDTVHPSIQGHFALAQNLWDGLAAAGVL